MNITHESIEQHIQVEAWQNVKGATQPMWVLRNFREITGDGALTHSCGCRVLIGDWLVKTKSIAAMAFTDQEFKTLFQPVLGTNVTDKSGTLQ